MSYFVFHYIFNFFMFRTIKNSQNVLSEIKGRILNDKLQRKEEGVLSEKINEIHDQIMK